MKYNEVIFDDVVIEKNNKWSQVCDSCAKKYFNDEVWDEIPAEGFTCGIENCNNEAEYYLDFRNEK